MVIQFSIGNYRSFNSIQTVNFRATSLVSEDKTVDENNIVEVAGQRMLKTLGVYGANGSGKSNLVKGLAFFKSMIKNSLEKQDMLLLASPNLSSINSELLGFFQIVLLLEGKKFRYGFGINNKRELTEWLFGTAEKNETWYFKRKGKEIEINREYFSEAVKTPYDSNLRSDALLLTFCSSYNGKVSGMLRSYISNEIIIDNGNQNNNSSTNEMIKKGNKEIVLSWLSDAGLHYTDIIIKGKISTANYRLSDDAYVSENNFNLPPQVKFYKSIHLDDGNITTAVMDLEKDESQGTQKFYALIGQLNNIFENGGLLISDEIDSNFHPTLLRKIISLFNNPKINRANAQLLFTSHDTNLMDPEFMRRDQFYLSEKSVADNTVMYALSELKGIRNNADFAKQYLAGFYGAIPYLGNFIEEN